MTQSALLFYLGAQRELLLGNSPDGHHIFIDLPADIQPVISGGSIEIHS